MNISLVQTLLSAVVSFLFSGLVLNLMLQKWQYRNWINQQKMLKANLDLAELKKVTEQITVLSDKRNYRARRLGRTVIGGSAEEIEQIKKDYSDAVTAWNDSWNSFTTKLTMYADFENFVNRLNDLQDRFVVAGGLVNYLLKSQNLSESHRIKARLEECLDSISGSTYYLSRALLKVILIKEKEAYSDPRESFTLENYESASTLKLIKYIFVNPHL
jgi:hypothetical protein